MTERATRYIGINQRIPFAVLDYGLSIFLMEGSIEKARLRDFMLQFTKGVNRADKAAAYAKAILTRPVTLLQALREHLPGDSYKNLQEAERKSLLLALFVTTYPIAYELLIYLAKTFKVQAQVATASINQHMGRLYGSNRTLAVAIDALLPMLIDLGAFKRTKLSIYEQEAQVRLTTPIVSEAWIFADLVASGTKTVQLEEIRTRPWYLYCKPISKSLAPNGLIRYENGIIGGGYISLIRE